MASAEEVLANARPLHAHSTNIHPISTTSQALVVATRLLVAGMTWVPLVSVGLALESVRGSGRIVVKAHPGQETLLDCHVAEGVSNMLNYQWTMHPDWKQVMAHEVLVSFCCLSAGDQFSFNGAVSAIVAMPEPSAIDLLGRLAD